MTSGRLRSASGASPGIRPGPRSRLPHVVALVFLVAGAGCADGTEDGARSGDADTTPGPVDFRDFALPPIAPSRDGLPPVRASSDAPPERYGFGRPARPDEIEAWDADVLPDGTGLPPGSGTPALGGVIYAGKCATCHGATGEEGPEPALVGEWRLEGFPFGESPYYYPTVGTYWPYATTLFDYIRRAMPHDAPGTLQPTEVYALVAWILWRSGLVSEDATLDARSLPDVVMPARGHFVVDDREGGKEVR